MQPKMIFYIDCPQSVIDHFEHYAGKQIVTESCGQQTERYARGVYFFKCTWKVLWLG